MGAFERNLTHLCDTVRPVYQQNAINEVVPSFVSWLTDQPCQLVEKEEKINDPATGLQMKQMDMLLFAPGVDVKADDQVVNIRVENEVIRAGPFTIEKVIPRRLRDTIHHLMVRLEKIGEES